MLDSFSLVISFQNEWISWTPEVASLIFLSITMNNPLQFVFISTLSGHISATSLASRSLRLVHMFFHMAPVILDSFLV